MFVDDVAFVCLTSFWYKQANGLASQDLLEKYFHDALLVDDLIARKTEQGLYESNPDFPSREDLAKTIYF